MFAKEIQKLKIALTTDCVLNCRHCRIDKSAHLKIDYVDAVKAIDLLIESKGQYKRLEIYGGEPFLEMALFKKIIVYAVKKISSENKFLSLSVATNGLLANKEILAFLKKYKINLSVSVSGSKENHDYCRVYPDGRGSWDNLEKKLKLILSEMDAKDVVALQCAAPNGAKTVCRDLITLSEKGFKVINLECVHGMEWTENNLRELENSLNEYDNYINKEISSGNFIVPEPFIEFFRISGSNAAVFCPMYRDLELYPDGTYSFYPFAFIHYKDCKDKVLIGNAKKGLDKKYIECSQSEKLCANCVSEYYTIPGLSSGAEAYSLRTQIMRKMFLNIMLKAKKERIFLEYAKHLAQLKQDEYIDYNKIL